MPRPVPPIAAPLTRRLLSALFLLGALLLGLLPLPGLVTPASAQIPVTDAAHIALNSYWHFAHYLQFAEQILQQYQQLVAQGRQIENQLLALRKLAHPNWREIATLLTELDAVLRTGRALTYVLPQVAAEFGNTFPGWTAWTDPATPQLQATRAIDTMRAGLAAAGRQGESFAAGEQTLAAIRDQTASTRGHQEALEQLVTLESFSAQELLLLRQALAASSSMQAVGSGYWLDREAQGQATRDLVLAGSALAAYQDTSPGWTFLPAWWPFN